jgi:hypothetical protein
MERCEWRTSTEARNRLGRDTATLESERNGVVADRARIVEGTSVYAKGSGRCALANANDRPTASATGAERKLPMKGNGGMRKSGGGINSRVNKTVPVRRGAPATGVRPGAVSQFGEALGNHATGSGKALRGGAERYATATPAGGRGPLGNEVATNVGKGGPGAGRTIHKTGSQQGMPVTPQAIGPTRDTLAEFGPDSANARNRR